MLERFPEFVELLLPVIVCAEVRGVGAVRIELDEAVAVDEVKPADLIFVAGQPATHTPSAHRCTQSGRARDTGSYFFSISTTVSMSLSRSNLSL